MGDEWFERNAILSALGFLICAAVVPMPRWARAALVAMATGTLGWLVLLP
jgi:hypothetical protein